MAGSQRESPETVGGGKDRERECCLYLFTQLKDVRVGLENPDLHEKQKSETCLTFPTIIIVNELM